MSVINRMLQELESRHEAPQGRLPGMVRAVPPPAASRRRPVLFALIGVLLLGAAGVWAWRAFSGRPPAVPAVMPLRPAPVAAPAASPSPPSPQPLQVPAERMVSETALTPRSNAGTLAARTAVARAARTEPAPAQPEPKPVPVPASVPDAAEPSIRKAAPNTLPEPAAAEDMKRISPAQRADRRYREALALISQGRMGEAQAMLEEALKLDPRHLGARQALLGVLLDGGHPDQAERLLQDGLALDVAPSNLAMALARLQTERGDRGAALATLERYLPQGRGTPDYEAFLAALLQRAERYEEAVGHYQAALRAQPARAVWWMGLGMALQGQKRTTEAERAFGRARALPGLTPELRAFVDQRLKQLQSSREPGAER